MSNPARHLLVQQGPSGFRGFGTKPLGRVVLIAVAIVAVAFGTIYLSEIIGIAILLLFGLALPIYTGWKRPRGLAIAGAVILLLSAPIAAVLVTNQYFQAPGPASSFGSTADGEYGGAVLQNATTSPYSAAGGGLFHFQVTIEPKYLDRNATLLGVTLFVSTCPESTQANETTSVCAPPYPSHQTTQAFSATPAGATTVTLNASLDGPNIWWWTIWASWNYSNRSGAPVQYIFLNANNGYNDILGPVVGDFLGVFSLIVVPVYLAILVYPGIVFYVALLFYAWYKGREARRKAAEREEEEDAGATAAPTTASAKEGAPPAAKAEERHCPKCGAVVYASETQCWKCGTPLGSTGAGTAPAPDRPSGDDKPLP